MESMNKSLAFPGSRNPDCTSAHNRCRIKVITIRITIRIMITMLLLMCCSCSSDPQERAWFVMGTYASVSTGSRDAGRIDEAEKVASAEFQRLEQMWSDYIESSEISLLRRGAGENIKVSPDTYELLSLSVDIAKRTEGCFDPTVGPLVDLWGIGRRKEFVIPSKEEIERVSALCGWTNILLNGELSVRLAVDGMMFDPGGIGKGLAVDKCTEILGEAGFGDYMINLGGNMRCFGSAGRGRNWRVGVRDPFRQGSVLGVLELSGGLAVATSGNYERFVEKDGKRYAHILDPLTGRPVEGMAGVTVVGSTAAEVDALSTALFVAGVEEGMRILSGFPDAEAVFIPDRTPLEIYISPGMAKYFTQSEGVAVKTLAAD